MIRGIKADYSTKYFFVFGDRIFGRDARGKPYFVDFVR